MPGDSEILDAVEHYAVGEKLRAATVNALIDAARARLMVEFGFTDSSGSGSANNTRYNPWPIMFKNNSSEDIPAYGVVEVKTPTTLAGLPAVNVDKIPAAGTAEYRRRYLVNGPRVSPAGKPGWGNYLEHTGLVLYDTADGAPDLNSEWGVAAGSFKLKKDRYGFIPQGGTMTQFGNVALMKQHVVDDLLVKCSAASSGSPWAVDATKDVEVWSKEHTANTDLIIKNVMNRTVAITSASDLLTLTWFAGGPIAAKLKC